jgi:hypothetical protein
VPLAVRASAATQKSSAHADHGLAPSIGGSFRPTAGLIAGGAGFIGSHLGQVQVLAGFGADVAILDDLSVGSRQNITTPREASGGHIRLIEGSIAEPDAGAAAMAGRRYVFHHAALTSAPESLSKPVTRASSIHSSRLSVPSPFRGENREGSSQPATFGARPPPDLPLRGGGFKRETLR